MVKRKLTVSVTPDVYEYLLSIANSPRAIGAAIETLVNEHRVGQAIDKLIAKIQAK